MRTVENSQFRRTGPGPTHEAVDKEDAIHARVLVVDDDVAVRTLLSVVLADDSWDVVVAGTIEEALAIVHDGGITVVVLDRHLVDADGIELLEDLGRATETGTIPVILISARADHDSRVAGLDAGALDFVDKDMTPVELKARVRSHVNHAGRLAALVADRARDQDLLIDASAAMVRATTSVDVARTATSRALGLPDVDLAVVVGFVGPGSGRVIALSGSTVGVSLSSGAPVPPEADRALRAQAGEGPWVEPASGMALSSVIGGAPSLVCAAPLVQDGRTIGILGTASLRGTRERSRILSGTAGLARAAASRFGELLSAEARTRHDLDALEAAVAGNGVASVFQPVVRTETRTVEGFEALTRFRDGQPPEPRFRSAGLLGVGVELQLAAITQQLRAAEALPTTAWVALNLSPSVILDHRLPAVLGRTDRQVVLELTEHDPIDDYDRLLTAFRDLPSSPRLSIDDAGSGYACLAHVLALEPDFVKLDKAWIREVDTDGARQALISGVRGFAEELGAQVIAEGVERVEELAVLEDLGVSLAQGHLLGEPRSAAEAEPTKGPGRP
ncbi:EAL domain-containing protein [Euzebya rosea]|uniref:EAL domain-containing protein n=1 Tax=Euzebya rosea TaxID=2052804 RepID=UPI000D3E8B90|nr:EAL domain-containing protein [Euzebya rosea]